MHQCEEFRERITEHIIDREDLAANAEFQHELLKCSSCEEFYADSREMMEALASVDVSISDREWNGIQQRLNARILNVPVEKWGRSPINPFFWFQKWVNRAMTPFFGAAAAILLITIGMSRLPAPVAGTPTPVDAPQQAVYVEHSVPLDPVTVDFLEASELLLRNVMKMAPSDVEDLADAKHVASEQLAGLEQRKEAAVNVPPVVGVMETYETVLRDLRNVDERDAEEDISDIQKRIQKNALIANMKAFQPRVTEISFGLR